MTTINIRQPAIFQKRSRFGMSLIEVMVGMIIFFLLFSYTLTALAPTATDSHNLLRGVTIAMNGANWYLNEMERRINYQGLLPLSDLGENDITSLFESELFSDISMLRSLQVISNITFENDIYNLNVEFRWGNHDRDRRRPHRFSLSRLKTPPGI